MTPTESQLLDAIRAEPGLALRVYVTKVGAQYGTVARAAQRLHAAGLVKRTGATRSTRYWPADVTLRV